MAKGEDGRKDLKDIDVDESDWLKEAMRSRTDWKTVLRKRIERYFTGYAVKT